MKKHGTIYCYYGQQHSHEKMCLSSRYTESFGADSVAVTEASDDYSALRELLGQCTSEDQIIVCSPLCLGDDPDTAARHYNELLNTGAEICISDAPWLDSSIVSVLPSVYALVDYEAAAPYRGLLTEIQNISLAAYQEIALMQFRVTYHTLTDRETIRATTSKATTRHTSSKQKKSLRLNKEKSKAEILKNSRDFGGTLSDSRIIRICGISESTYYRYKRELYEEKHGVQTPLDQLCFYDLAEQ